MAAVARLDANDLAALPPRGKLAALRQLLAEKFPSVEIKRSEMWATGWAALDAGRGGLCPGVVTELASSLGNGGLFIEGMLQAAQRCGRFWALVDAKGTFDPCGSEGPALERMLWVQCANGEQAMKATDMLLRDGNLSLVVLDLQALPLKELRRIPANTWHRFQRLVEGTTMVFVVLTPQPMVESARMRIAVRNCWNARALKESRAHLLERMQMQVFVRGQNLEPEVVGSKLA